MKPVSVLFLFLALCLPVLTARAEDPSIDTAIATLENQISRDEGIVSHPANIAATKQARLQIGDGLPAFQSVIANFERHFAAVDPQMIKDLNRILDEEKEEAANERFSHRYLDSTRETVKRNLPLKKAILKRARDLANGQ